MHRLISRGHPGSLPGVPPVVASLLLARGIDTPEKARAFLHPEEGQLTDPFLLDGMERACALIRQAVKGGDSIVVYGDYDCDGVCASAILWEALQGLGARAEIYIPSRKE